MTSFGRVRLIFPSGRGISPFIARISLFFGATSQPSTYPVARSSTFNTSATRGTSINYMVYCTIHRFLNILADEGRC